MNDGEHPDQRVGIPYWDWTKDNEIPGFATQGPWQRAHLNGENQDPTHRDFNVLDSEMLAGRIKTAFEQDTTLEFNRHINLPHGQVHDFINGTMGAVPTASYDPIFYLHHSYVDLQYAYWQELQKLRNITVEFNSDNGDSPMQPFASPEVNAFAETLLHSTANSGLQYEENFHYKYDQLLFQGKTPYEFHVDETATAGTKEQFFAGFSIKDMTVTSKIFF